MVRTPIIVAGFVTLAIATTYWFVLPHRSADQERERKLARVERELAELWKGLVLRDAGLDHDVPVSTRDMAFAARDLVYRLTPIGEGQFRESDPVTTYLKLSAGETQMLCGGIADAYRFLLSKLGVRSRPVQLAGANYVEGGRRGDTHASVEVFDDRTGRWYVSDPTFNVSWRCEDDHPLASYEELRACNAQGRALRADSNGQPLIAGRAVQDYYLPYESLLYGMRIYSEDRRSVLLDLPSEGWVEEAERKYR